MAELIYENFDLAFNKLGQGGYRVEVSASGGEPSAAWTLPFSDDDLKALRESFEQPARDVRQDQPKRLSRDAEISDMVKNLGGRLFDAVFSEEVRASFSTSLDRAKTKEAGLRIRLRFGDDVPELAELPWEYLYSRSRQSFFALSDQTPIVRYLSLPEPTPLLLVKPPLKVLVMVSNPNNYQSLEVEKEWTVLYKGLETLVKRGEVAIDRLPKATPATLHEKLMQGDYNVFHFIGHGDFDSQNKKGVLIMEDDSGKGRPVGQDVLRVLLDHFRLRLTILNACEGARVSQTHPFTGVAQSLVQQGIPAVIAMQFKITDEAAIIWASMFYGAVAAGRSIDAALAEARKAIFYQPNPIEWGTPVLYMRSPDGKIFQIDRPTEEEKRRAQIEALSRDAQDAIERKDYALAINKLETILNLDPPRPIAQAP